MKKTAKKARNLRAKARKKFDELLQLFDYKCYYCSLRVARIKNVECLFTDQRRVVYVDNGIHLAKVATLDHVLDISKGGNSHENNLVIACGECNHLKSHRKYHARVKAKPKVIDGYQTNMPLYDFKFFFWAMENMEPKVIRREGNDELIEISKKLFLKKDKAVFYIK